MTEKDNKNMKYSQKLKAENPKVKNKIAQNISFPRCDGILNPQAM